MKSLWTGWICFLLLSVGLADAGAQTGPRPLRIGAVVDGPWERNVELYQALDGILRDVLGARVDVRILDGRMQEGDWTLAGVRAVDDRLLARPDVDMIIAMGVIASHDLATRGPLPKP